MNCELRLFGGLRTYLPEGSEGFSCQMELKEGTTVDDLLQKVKIPREISKIILVNAIHAEVQQVLEEGDKVSVFPPVAGGCLKLQPNLGLAKK